jgi:hypothetical protein
MNRKRVARSLLLAVFWAVAVRAPASSVQARRGTPLPPSLAKAKLTDSTTAAKKWRPDAVLIQIAGRSVGADGLLVVWDYGYWSASAKTCLLVNIGPPGSPPYTMEADGPMCEAPELKGEIIDSDRAMSIARSNGITAPTSNMAVSMSTTRQGMRAVWMVMDGGGTAPGNVILDIDAQTGAVLDKTTQR